MIRYIPKVPLCSCYRQLIVPKLPQLPAQVRKLPQSSVQQCFSTNIRTLALRECPRMKRNYNNNTGFTLTKKYIHTTQSISAAPLLAPLLLKLTTPISRLLFLLLGRRFRSWWKKLPKDKKTKYINNFIKSRNRMGFLTGLFIGTSAAYYIYHLENTPVTGRKRFMILNKEQLEDIANIEWRNLNTELSSMLLPTDSPFHVRVFRVAQRILQSNISKEVSSVSWEINVVNSDEVNAFVLANGQIYVYTGMLKAVENDSELAGILGHEIAHAILGHSAENLSRAGFFNLYSIAILAGLWAIMPTDILAVFASWLQANIEDILISLPYSRKLEKEADEVGLKLAARACYDVRHVPNFWTRMHNEDRDTVMQQNDWLSTHPSHENRINWITEWLPDALLLRSNFDCPELRHFVEAVNIKK